MTENPFLLTISAKQVPADQTSIIITDLRLLCGLTRASV